MTITDKLRRDHPLTQIIPEWKPLPVNPNGLEAAEALETLKTALEFYANGIGYTEAEDGGMTARTALEAVFGTDA